MGELLLNLESRGTFEDASSCAGLLAACANAMAGTKDSVAPGLDSMCMLGGVTGHVLEKHPHVILSMVKAKAKVPRHTSTVMSTRSNAELRKIVPAFNTTGIWYQFVARHICNSCGTLLLDFWWSWSTRRGADSRWRSSNLDQTYCGQLLCGWGKPVPDSPHDHQHSH